VVKDEWMYTDKEYVCRIKFNVDTISITDILDPIVIKAEKAGRVGPKGIKYFASL
jgi:hypothetical protein